jgi:L-lactate dehydrogenase complex protein LldG
MAAALVKKFREKYESLAGHVHLVDDVCEAADVIMMVLKEDVGDRLALGELPTQLVEQIEGRCQEQGVELLQPPYDNTILPQSIDDSHVGVTRAALGIAEAGALIELTTNDATRLVSTLPRVHIGIIWESDLRESLREAGQPLKVFFEENPENATATFISGPSRTADIEMRLTLGVHGPEVAHTIILSR